MCVFSWLKKIKLAFNEKVPHARAYLKLSACALILCYNSAVFNNNNCLIWKKVILIADGCIRVLYSLLNLK